MIRLLPGILLTPFVLAACVTGEGRVVAADGELTVRVLSFNIRYGTAPDGPNAWVHRDHLVYEVIRREGSDFVGLQEALRFQVDAIRDAVPGYGLVGVGRESGGEAGEYSAILYRTDRWTVADSGTFWLSDTPEVPGSKSWGNEITRIATWARFVEADTGRAVWVFNTHFDHASQPSRVRSAELLASRIAAREPRDPVIVTGDFNAGEDNPAIRYLKNAGGRSPLQLVDTYRVRHPEATGVGTFNGFGGRQDGQDGRNGAKIDYVFAEPEAAVRAAEIIRDHRDGRYPSDHYPVSAELTLQSHEERPAQR